MIIERIVYCLVCLILFGYVGNKYLKTKSGIYLALLAIQLVCMITQLVAFFTKIYVDIFMQLYILVFNIILPAGIFVAEYLNINFEEYLEIKMGDFYARRNKYDQAIEKYKKAISKNNNNAQTFAKLGRIYNAKGDRRTAFDRFARAIEINRNDYRSYYEIGVIFNDMGKQADAQIVLDNSLRIKPDFTPASELLAVVLCAQNKYDEAINVYKNATRYDPDNYQLYYSMGVVRTELRDFSDAKACYEKAIELNPSLYQAYFSLGQINLLKGELEQAEKMFKKAMVSKDLTAKSYYQLAKVHILNDEEIKAVTYLGYAIDIDSSYKYKAESEPLFAKIKDYITGISMANKVIQKVENEEVLRKNKVDEEIKDVSEEKKELEENLNVIREKLSEETKKVVETEEVTNPDNEIVEESEDTDNTPKENKFFNVFKKVLGYDESIESANDIEEKIEEENEEKNVEEVDKKDDEQEKIETFGTLDIFEKFKKLKKEEDEKAERYRRIQKLKQLEELKKESNENKVTYNPNEDYYEEDGPVVVRVVGNNESEEKTKREDLEELKAALESKLETSKLYEKKVSSSYYKEDAAKNETFEDKDTMDEPHFDFMDRYRRK